MGLRSVLLLVACAAMLWRVLQPGVLPYGHDTFTHDFPIHLWAWGEVARSGELPLWIPHLQNGLPTLGSFAWCPLYPTDWLMGLSVAGGFRLQWWLLLAIAGFGMVAWGRAAGLDVPGRWTAAVAFALSGHLVTLISPGHLQKAQAIAWLPWALAAVEWGLGGSGRNRSGGRAGSGALSDFTGPIMGRAILGGLGCGAAVGVQFLASHTQIAYLTMLLAGWRAVWLAAIRAFGFQYSNIIEEGRLDGREDSPPRTLPPHALSQSERVEPTHKHHGDPTSPLAHAGSKPGGRSTRLGLAVVALAAWCVAMPLAAGVVGGAELLTGLETARMSNRAAGVTYEEAVLTSYPPLETFEYLFPRFLGDSVRGGWNAYAGEWGERLVTDYAGAGAILLALIGLASGGRRKGLRVWLALTFVATLLLAFGRYMPFYEFAYRRLPGFNRFRSPGTQMVLAAWALAALAGAGMETLREAFARPGARARRWTLGLVALASLSVAVGWGMRSLGARAGDLAQSLGAAPEPSRLQYHRAILFDSVGGTCLWAGIFSAALLAALLLESRKGRLVEEEARRPGMSDKRDTSNGPETPDLRIGSDRSVGSDGSDRLERSGRRESMESPAPSKSCWHPARWAMFLPAALLALDLILRLQPFLSPEDTRPYLAFLLQSPVDITIARDPRIPHRLIEHGNELTVRPILNGIDVPMGYHPVTYRWMQEAMEALGLESAGLRAVWAVDYIRVPGVHEPDGSTSWTLALPGPGWSLWRDRAAPPFARFPVSLAAGEPARDLPRLMDSFGNDPTRPALVTPDEAKAIRAWLEAEGPAELDAPHEEETNDAPAKPVGSDLSDRSDKSDEPDRSDGSGQSSKTIPVSVAARVDSDRSPWAVVLKQGAGDWVVRVGSDGPQWIVLSAVPAPGWRAYAGAREPVELPIWRADASSSLVPWPGGEDMLVLEYDPWSARFGIFLTFFGAGVLALAAGWWLGGALSGRTRRRLHAAER